MKYTDPYSTSRSRKVKNTLALLVLFAMTATVIYLVLSYFCSLSMQSEYYTPQQIDDYVTDVFGEACEFVAHPEENGDTNTYIYEDARGIKFTVSSENEALICIDGSCAPPYRKYVTDNYIESVITNYMDRFQTAAENLGLEVGYTSGNKTYSVILHKSDQIETAAKLICMIDSWLDLDLDYSDGDLRTSPYQGTYKIILYQKTENTDQSQSYQSRNQICEFEISLTPRDRLREKKVLHRIRLNW